MQKSPQKSNNKTAVRTQSEKDLKALKNQDKNLKELQVNLEHLEKKVKNHQPLSEKDINFIGSLGWLTALAVTISSLAASI